MTISATVQGIRPGVCTSTSRPSAPFDGQVIYETDTNTLAVYDGSAWVSLNPVDRDRNVIINGAMQVHQRGTSTTGITSTGYYVADRWSQGISSMGTWTQTIENDAPTGSGFRKSLKLLCTTSDASPAATDLVSFLHDFEGQNVQRFAKGTSLAKGFSLSFWVKSNVTGTYVVCLQDLDNTRYVGAQYTVSVSETWEKKTITFPADTTGAFDNDNAASLRLRFWLGAGSDRTSGTLRTSWTSTTTADLAVGQTNVAAATNNYWQITGVQLEAGAVATPFEFEDYGTTLAKCQRYYWRSQDTGQTAIHAFGYARSSTIACFHFVHPVAMRAKTSSVEFSTLRCDARGVEGFNVSAVSLLTDFGTTRTSFADFTASSGMTTHRPYDLVNQSSTSGFIAFSAEL